MKVISLGWGVQSFTLAAMVALGELEQVDYAIHADTTHESSLTYQFRGRWENWLIERGVPVRVVTPTRYTQPIRYEDGKKPVVDIPAYVMGGAPGFGRHCTGFWKIVPMRSFLQANRKGERVEQWLGISMDEWQRMKDSDVAYITNRYPLIEMKMTRADCVKWLRAHNLEVPPKSACNFCPFHTTAEWREIKKVKTDWHDAVRVDDEIRNARPPYPLFLHPSRRPLEEVDFRTAEEKGQLSLWDNECSGICGV